MAIFPVRKFGDPVLKEKAQPVEKIDNGVRELARNLIDTMNGADGVGLAAPQIGVLKRLIVFNARDSKKPRVLINPEIISISEEEIEDEEACLSVPAAEVKIKRAKTVTIKGLNLEGNKVTYKASELLARILQHELNHLDGQLILDKTSEKDRKKALKEISLGITKPEGGTSPL